MSDVVFSSRRRHTSWNCDWSSDVCSSDLISAYGIGGLGSGATPQTSGAQGGRSEERRVGKECRSRWSPSPLKKGDGFWMDSVCALCASVFSRGLSSVPSVDTLLVHGVLRL